MVIGVIQVLVYGPLAALQWIAGGARRAETLDKAARGLGKVLWWTPFKIRFYGHTA